MVDQLLQAQLLCYLVLQGEAVAVQQELLHVVAASMGLFLSNMYLEEEESSYCC